MNVVDASVVVKWFVVEPGHAEALSFLKAGQDMIAPDFLLLETANVLRRKWKRGELSQRQWREIGATLPRYFSRLVPLESVMDAAVDLSIRLDHPVYDCLYLAVAVVERCVLITADDVFSRRCGIEGLAGHVVGLAEWFSDRQGAVLDGSVIDQILALHDRFEQTFSPVRDQVSRPFGSTGRRMTKPGDVGPAWDSPAYLNLRRSIAGLGRPDRARLLALAWLGQGHSGDDWPAVIRRAEAYLSDDPGLHLDYLISKIEHVRQGSTRLAQLSERPVPDDAPNDDAPDDKA